jgi:hypothetical protein
MTAKGERYAAFALSAPFQRNQMLGSFVFHFCGDEFVFPEYHFTRLGQSRFAIAMPRSDTW